MRSTAMIVFFATSGSTDLVRTCSCSSICCSCLRPFGESAMDAMALHAYTVRLHVFSFMLLDSSRPGCIKERRERLDDARRDGRRLRALAVGRACAVAHDGEYGSGGRLRALVGVAKHDDDFPEDAGVEGDALRPAQVQRRQVEASLAAKTTSLLSSRSTATGTAPFLMASSSPSGFWHMRPSAWRPKPGMRAWVGHRRAPTRIDRCTA